MTPKEKLLKLLPSLTETQAERALHALEQNAALTGYLDAEAKLSLAAREDTRATASARDAVREEPWDRAILNAIAGGERTFSAISRVAGLPSGQLSRPLAYSTSGNCSPRRLTRD